MSEFLLNEAMGANRVANMQQQNMLLNAGQDDSAYDPFIANQPNGGEGVVEDDDDYQSAQDHVSDGGDGGSMDGEGSQGGGGLIEEEPSVDNAPAQLPGQIVPVAGAGGGAMAGAAAAGPVTHFSNEAPQRTFNPAEWDTGRSDKIKGQYWKTFGERMKATGGGVSGFFKALFGKGMARANRAEEKRAFLQAPILQARAWRQQRRADGSEAVPARSALRTRLAGAPIENLSTFPREPGIAYDEPAATATHAGFMQARAQHHDAYEDGAQDAFMGNIASIGGIARGEAAERTMKNAYAEYDKTVGNQTLFEGVPNRFDAKARALANANRRAGADVFANMGRPRRTPQRVRFKDGADDQVGQPVNDPAAGPENKPMPTSVRFFPAPIGMRTFEREAKASPEYRTLRRSDEYRALTPEQQAERKKALFAELLGPGKKYVEGLGDTGHPDEISDEQALENERFAWPVRARMMRMNEMDRFRAMGQHEVTAMNLEAQARRDGTDPLDSDDYRDHSLRASIGAEAQRDLEEKQAQDRVHRLKRSTDTTLLGPEVKSAAGDILRLQGARIDPNVDLAAQMPRLPRNFFDSYLKEGEQRARQAANGGGGGGLIEEEEPQG